MASYFLGLTGASGHPYALRLMEALITTGNDVHVSFSGAGSKVFRHELGLAPTEEGLRGALAGRLEDPASAEALRVFPSEANFLLVETTDVQEVIERARAQGIIIRDRSNQPNLEGCVRVSVGARAQNQALLDALQPGEDAR